METGLMTAPPAVAHECIADLFVICDRVQPFCLMAAPPYYHTDHDTIDKLSEEGLDRKSTRLNSSHIQKSRMPSSA